MAKDNLFAIDLDATLRAVSDANAGLVERHVRPLAALARVPATLASASDVERARQFVEQLTEAAERCRNTRLADVQPLHTLVARVEEFFKSMEAEAAAARREVMGRLDDPSVVVVDAASGRACATIGPVDPAPTPRIAMTWSVESIERASLDLEALRPFLTEAAILTAARAHLKARGLHALRGATYAEGAAPW